MAEPRRSADTEASELNGARVLIVEARFYEDIADALFAGASRALRAAGAVFDRVSVPGSLEIPPVAKRLAESGSYAAVICLGAVIRGDTGHYDHVAAGAASGVAQVVLATGVPVIFGLWPILGLASQI